MNADGGGGMLAPDVSVAEPILLFGHWLCPYSVRVEFALAQFALPYQVVDVPPTAARPKGFVVPEEFLEHSPHHEIPMIRHAGQYLADSLPILDHLSRAVGRFDAASAQLARVLDQMFFPPMIGIYYGIDPSSIGVAVDRLDQAFGELESMLGQSQWLSGDEPSMAEAAYVPVIVRLEGLRGLGFDRDLPPAVDAHRRRCMELRGGGAVQWSAEQTTEFVWRFTTFRERRSSAADL